MNRVSLGLAGAWSTQNGPFPGPTCGRSRANPALLAIVAMATACVWTGICSAEPSAESEPTPVFAMQDLFRSVRIPNVVVATDGTVLAFAMSGRLVRRSEDGGRTFRPAQEVGSEAAGSAIVDDNSGDVMVVHPKGGHLWRSHDHGKTWNCEEIVVRPNPLGHGSLKGVAAQTTCSESGITLRYGEHNGRLLMPARVQPPKGNNEQEWWPYNYNTAIYSDDGGKTWQTSGPVQNGTGEGISTF